VIVFNTDRPIRREPEFETSARGAAPTRFASRGEKQTARDTENVVLVAGDSAAALHVKQDVVPSVADLAGEQPKRVDARTDAIAKMTVPPEASWQPSGAGVKWPSKNSERANDVLWPNPYLVIDGTLDECIKKFLEQPASQCHLYEIHTSPQGELVSAVMSAEHVVEIAPLRDFL
jgi:hypothetical protein